SAAHFPNDDGGSQELATVVAWLPRATLEAPRRAIALSPVRRIFLEPRDVRQSTAGTARRGPLCGRELTNTLSVPGSAFLGLPSDISRSFGRSGATVISCSVCLPAPSTASSLGSCRLA